jgi:hypothetical protein
MPAASALTFRLVAWKNGVASFARKAPSGFVSLTMSLLPLTTTPETCWVRPSSLAWAPSTFASRRTAGDLFVFVRTRSKAHAKFRAVTADPSEKRRPFLIVKV